MKHLLTHTRKMGRYVRFLPYVLLSALVAFVGGRSAGNDGHVVDHSRSDAQKKFGNYVIPTAFADTPHYEEDPSGGDADGDGCCFPGSVQVRTESGEVPIKDLREGDTVVSYDEAAGTFATSRIAKVLRHGDGEEPGHDFDTHPLLQFAYTDAGHERTLVLTSNHPVLDAATQTYRPAGEFAPGSQLVLASGDTVSITAVETLDASAHLGENPVVYNLTLTDGPHTYVAGGVVVHNKDGDADADCGP